MAEGLKERLTRNGTAVVLLCAAVILLFLVLFTFPGARSLEAARDLTAKMGRDFQVRTDMLPAYAKLKKERAVPLPKGVSEWRSQPLALDQVAGIPAAFATAAQESGLRLKSAVPRPESSQAEGRLLRVDVAAQGDFMRVRDFLLAVCSMPMVQEIQSVELAGLQAGAGVDVSVVLWAAVAD